MAYLTQYAVWCNLSPKVNRKPHGRGSQGTRGRPPPPDSGKTRWKIRAKKDKSKKNKNAEQRNQKNSPTCIPGNAAACAGFLEEGLRLGLLKSTFNTENFVCRLFWFNSSDIGAIHSWSGSHSLKSQKRKSFNLGLISHRFRDLGPIG